MTKKSVICAVGSVSVITKMERTGREGSFETIAAS